MKYSLQRLALVVVFSGVLAGSALAVPTALELGSVDPGSPASPTLETGYLTILINGYNTGKTGLLSDSFTGDSGHNYVLAPVAGIPTAPLPSVAVNEGQNSGGGGVQTGLNVGLGSGGYDYIMVKWGNEDEFYYIGGMTGNIVVNNNVNGNGESHYDLFTGSINTNIAAPDGGSTVALLGLAMTSLFAVGRIFRSTNP